MINRRQWQSEQFFTHLRRHPRVTFQQWAEDRPATERLVGTMPLLIPFGHARYRELIPVIDWDHRLPSERAYLRVFAYYSETTLRQGLAALDKREQEISHQDRFPEFDVPDYNGINADEAYEGQIDRTGEVTELRLVSAWRREIDPGVSKTALSVTRACAQFKELVSQAWGRPDYLGDLEAVSWTPPCESEYGSWTVDCWYLTYLDTSVGKGQSFLVDVNLQTVVGTRDFVVRSG